VLPALVALGLAAATGLLLGWTACGWAGLAGAAAGAIIELALPYVVVPRLVGFPDPDLGMYGEYLPGTLLAAVAAIVGASIGTRVATGRPLPVTWVLAAGLCVLTAWFGIWLVMSRSLCVAA
jgi:hypothetical protein